MIVRENKHPFDQKVKEIFQLMADNNKEFRMVKTTCDTFTRLLLSLTPFKAKEFVEKNCAKVSEMILCKSAQTLLKEEKDD